MSDNFKKNIDIVILRFSKFMVFINFLFAFLFLLLFLGYIIPKFILVFCIIVSISIGFLFTSAMFEAANKLK